MRPALAILALIVLPTLVLAAGYGGLLSQRSDYLGHFLAGAGGTLALVALGLAVVAVDRPRGLLPLVVAALCLLAIGVGAIFESTLYRLAKFDEVDFCNQSLGAVLVSLGAIAVFRRHGPKPILIASLLLIAAVLLAEGYHFAFR